MKLNIELAGEPLFNSLIELIEEEIEPKVKRLYRETYDYCNSHPSEEYYKEILTEERIKQFSSWLYTKFQQECPLG